MEDEVVVSEGGALADTFHRGAVQFEEEVSLRWEGHEELAGRAGGGDGYVR